MICERCNAEIPEGGRFCIDCGAPAPAATGPTERLPERTGTQLCATCGTRNPADAAFCVYCGQALTPERPTAAAPAPPPLLQPQMPAPLAPAMPRPTPMQPAQRSFAPAGWDGLTGGMWLIGLAVLFVTGWWWPGILVLVGLSSLFSGMAHANNPAARLGVLQSVVWTLGLAVVAWLNWWWPGILVLVGLSVLLGSAAARGRY